MSLFRKLPLPEYDWRQVWNRRHMRDPNLPLPNHFVREISISDIEPLLRYGISSMVEWADAELNTLAEYCDATVVPHAWGIARQIRTPEAKHDPFRLLIQSILTRAQYDLVAKVARVNVLSPPPEWENKLQTGMDQYATSDRQYYYCDRKLNQFMYGTIAGSPTPTTWLVDIDLLFLSASMHRQHFQPKH